MKTYIDIHRHNFSKTDHIFELVNILIHNQNIPKVGYYSVGWHPWYIEKYNLNEIEDKLLDAICKKNVLAIGEIGLDRAIKAPIELQLIVFKFQLRMAMKHKKPIVIHCVKAYADLLEIFNKELPTIPIIIHDFNENPTIANQLLKHNVYFSFGSQLLMNKQKKIDTLRAIPKNKLFLETDESLESIEKIYLHASNILSISNDELLEQISSNFKTVFGDGLVKQD